MGNHISNHHHSRSHSKNLSNSLSQKIRLLVIGYIRLYIKYNTENTRNSQFISLCSKYYGEAIINSIFQCKIDKYGYLISIDEANKFNEKKHRDKLRLEQIKLIEWQQYLFNQHSISPSVSMNSMNNNLSIEYRGKSDDKKVKTINKQKIQWNKVLNSNKFVSLVRSGIPEAFRPLLWKKFVEIEEIRKIAIENYGESTLFQDFVNHQQSPFHEEIWKDINKTNKNHTRFGLYNYSKEINNITINNDDLYQNIDHHEYNINNIKRRKQMKRRTRSAKRLSRSARTAIKQKHQLRSSSNSDILRLKEKYDKNKQYKNNRTFYSNHYRGINNNSRSSIHSIHSIHSIPSIPSTIHHSRSSINNMSRRSSAASTRSDSSHSSFGLLPLTAHESLPSLSSYSQNRSYHSKKQRSRSQSPQPHRKYNVTYFKHKVIDADTINRCGNHVDINEVERNATKTQLQLYNILKAFSLYQRSIGYTSNCGLSMIAGLLLLYMNEEEVFWFLNGLCDENEKYKMLNLWKPAVPDMSLRLFQMERLIEKYLSKISSHFHSKRIVSASMFYAQNWFKTLFTKTEITMMTHEVLFRIWDCYFSEGFIILFKFALGILKYNEQKLLKSKDIDDIIEILRDDINELNIDAFVKISLSFKITQTYLDKLRRNFYSN